MATTTRLVNLFGEVEAAFAPEVHVDDRHVGAAIPRKAEARQRWSTPRRRP